MTEVAMEDMWRPYRWRPEERSDVVLPPGAVRRPVRLGRSEEIADEIGLPGLTLYTAVHRQLERLVPASVAAQCFFELRIEHPGKPAHRFSGRSLTQQLTQETYRQMLLGADVYVCARLVRCPAPVGRKLECRHADLTTDHLTAWLPLEDDVEVVENRDNPRVPYIGIQQPRRVRDGMRGAQ